MEINPWLTYCILIFFCSTPWGVVYVLYIITNVFGKISLKIIPRIIAVANAFYVVYVLYIINEFLLPFYKKFSIKIIPHYFCGYCSNVQHFTTLKNILSIGFWENPYKYTTAVYPVCQLLFFDVFVLILSLIFLVKLFDIATFLMLMHTYSLFSFSKQIRASLSDENSG